MKKFLIPLLFGIVLTSYTGYSLLDTFVIPKEQGKAEYSSYDFGLSSSSNSSSKSSSSKKSSSSSASSSNNSSLPSSSYEFSSMSSATSSITTSDSSIVDSSSLIDGYFSDKVILTDNLYIDQNLHIEISKEVIQTKHMQIKNKMMDTIVYNADIRIRDLSHLSTALAHDKFGKNIVEHTSTMAERNKAIFACNGDYYGAQEAGYVLRNGTVFRDTKAKVGKSRLQQEDLAILRDGSFETFYDKDVKLDEYVKKGAYQVFCFGPALVKDSKVSVKESDEVSTFSNLGNQRCGFGIFEPLHYLVSICDGRLDTKEDPSYGMSLYEMGNYLQSKGVKIGYNLDGGGSATFWFNGKVLNRPNSYGKDDIGEREISDCIYFK